MKSHTPELSELSVEILVLIGETAFHLKKDNHDNG
jgi:hypothetical protein